MAISRRFLKGCPIPLTTSELPLPDLYEASLVELQAGLEQGNFSSVHLVKVSLTSST
jgi:hypothetical protein